MGKSSEYQESMKGTREKQGSGWEDDMPKKLGFDWQDAPLAWDSIPTYHDAPTTLPQPPTAPMPLTLPENKTKGNGDVDGGLAQSLTSMPLGCELAPTDDDRDAIAHALGELNRATARALIVISGAERALQGNMGACEQDLLRGAAGQLSKIAEEAEEMALPLSRAVKFQRVALDGGYCSTNLQVLTSQATDLLGRLLAACKMVRAISSHKDK